MKDELLQKHRDFRSALVDAFICLSYKTESRKKLTDNLGMNVYLFRNLTRLHPGLIVATNLCISVNNPLCDKLCSSMSDTGLKSKIINPVNRIYMTSNLLWCTDRASHVDLRNDSICSGAAGVPNRKQLQHFFGQTPEKGDYTKLPQLSNSEIFIVAMVKLLIGNAV